jgi:tRNA threonylcarbamoyladenosine biosynthesis protein TsaB
MAVILLVETATAVCSVALSKDGTLLGIRESVSRNAHSSSVTVFIDAIMSQAGIPLSHIDAVAVSMGPGSYTGLRIGVASAKGLCYALGKPLIAVPTLQAMANGLILSASVHPHDWTTELVCPLLDARRMEVYSAIYDKNLLEIRETRAEIIDGNSFGEYLRDHVLIFGGEGSEKCKPALGHHENARFIEGFETSARFMIPLADEKFGSGRFENPAYFEPYYLKEFVAGKPRVKGLR